MGARETDPTYVYPRTEFAQTHSGAQPPKKLHADCVSPATKKIEMLRSEHSRDSIDDASNAPDVHVTYQFMMGE
ncbi:MAG: hypothetical protein RhofKO_02560 [Rhodothermales bacterium]